MGVCLAAIGLVTLADLQTPAHASLDAIVFVPVLVAAWLLAPWPVALVVAAAMAASGLEAYAGMAHPLTALTRAATLPILALLARFAATNVVRTRRLERDAAHARDLDRAKSDFLRLASHELRAPVAIMRGYMSMLEDGSLGKLPEGVAQVMPVLGATAAGMTRIVDQMLDVARLEDSRLQLNVASADLGELVREVASDAELLHARSHPVVCRIAPMPRMAFDRARISTVLGNLLSNAIKYSPQGSEVAIRAEADGARVHVSVIDHGVGISESQMPRLFGRFSRIADPRTRDVSGTGLGLYLSRELARLHGGDITVKSKHGQGSTFTLHLPLARAPASRAPATKPARAVERPRVRAHRELAG